MFGVVCNTEKARGLNNNVRLLGLLGKSGSSPSNGSKKGLCHLVLLNLPEPQLVLLK